MRNEILLILSVLVCYGSVLVLFKIFREIGLFTWTVIATIAANIEVLILVKAFGMEQTLGNVLFASTFLVTDILSEIYGKKAANKAVLIGCATSAIFIILSQYWLCTRLGYASYEKHFFQYPQSYVCRFNSICNLSIV